SYLGTNPYMIAELDQGSARIWREGDQTIEAFDNPLDVVREELNRFRPIPVNGLPRFIGGAVGYLAYECARYFERLPSSEAAGLGLPEAVFFFVDTILVFDHIQHRILVISNVH